MSIQRKMPVSASGMAHMASQMIPLIQPVTSEAAIALAVPEKRERRSL